jgi:hypothetical protein
MILLMIMSGWHQSPNIDDRREPEPSVLIRPMPSLVPKPVKTIRIQIK